MKPSTRIIDDAEFLLPPEFLTDDDFLVQKENKVFKGDVSNNCLFPYETIHGFPLDSGFGSTVKKPIADEETFLTGLARNIVRSTLEDDFPGGFCGNQACPVVNDAMAWGATRSQQSTLCGAGGIGCGPRNQNCQTRVSSQAAEWDLYCATVEKLAMMSVHDKSYGYNNHSGSRGILDLPRKHPLAVAKIPNDGCDYYSRQSLQHQKIQAIQFQQLKQQQLMKQHRQLVQQSRGLRANNNNIAGHVDLSPSAWSNQPQRRDGSAMRAVFLGNRTGKRGSTGTGVFLPRRVNQTSSATPETREKSTLATVLVPARVAQVFNLDESVVQPSVRSSLSLNDASWRQRSNNGGFSSQMKIEQSVNEARLPSDWAYGPI